MLNPEIKEVMLKIIELYKIRNNILIYESLTEAQVEDLLEGIRYVIRMQQK